MLLPSSSLNLIKIQSHQREDELFIDLSVTLLMKNNQYVISIEVIQLMKNVIWCIFSSLLIGWSVTQQHCAQGCRGGCKLYYINTAVGAKI